VWYNRIDPLEYLSGRERVSSLTIVSVTAYAYTQNVSKVGSSTTVLNHHVSHIKSPPKDNKNKKR